MLRTIDRYVIRESIVPTLLGLLVFTFILQIQPVMEVAERLIAKGVAWSTVGRIMLTLLPQALGKRLALLFTQAKAAGELPANLDCTLAPVLFNGAVQGPVIQSALAGDENAMRKRARQLFPLLLDGSRGRRKR